MGRFERSRSRSGLDDLGEYECYCYFVAGVVEAMRDAGYQAMEVRIG
jgi:hypothetical protein